MWENGGRGEKGHRVCIGLKRRVEACSLGGIGKTLMRK